MPVFRETPYGAFNFLVELERGQGKEPRAGFSEVSGLNTEITVAEYRSGNDPQNHVRKLPGIYKSGDVTLKRGIMGADDIWKWVTAVREGRPLAEAKREVMIRMLDEQRDKVVVSWKLRGAMPLKWTGPTLNAKGGGDVAMEELVLSVESVEMES
jgi:phage tail-like protein